MWTAHPAKAVQVVVRAKSVHAAIGQRLCSASLAMCNGKTRQSLTTCSRRHSGKMAAVTAVEAEAAQAARAVVSVKVILAVVAMQAGKVSRAGVTVLHDQTTRPAVLSQIR
jgi:hypothetical protein